MFSVYKNNMRLFTGTYEECVAFIEYRKKTYAGTFKGNMKNAVILAN